MFTKKPSQVRKNFTCNMFQPGNIDFYQGLVMLQYSHFTALIKVNVTGLKHVACKHFANLAWFFRKHCSIGYLIFSDLFIFIFDREWEIIHFSNYFPTLVGLFCLYRLQEHL